MNTERKIWGEGGFEEKYVNLRDIIVPCVERLEAVFYGFFRNIVREENPVVCELGCGDGTTAEGLLKINPSMRIYLFDGSPGMLERAKRRLSSFPSVEFIEADFSELVENGLGRGGFHLVYSSLALHHLKREDKRTLLGHIIGSLVRGGYFVNMDTVVPPSPELEGWYEKTHREEMDERALERGLEPVSEEVMRRASVAEHRQKLLSLEEELELLKEAGFSPVECFYKYLGFCVYGGKRP